MVLWHFAGVFVSYRVLLTCTYGSRKCWAKCAWPRSTGAEDSGMDCADAGSAWLEDASAEESWPISV